MRTACLLLVLALVSCKEKQEAKPAPAPGSAAAPAAPVAPQGSAAADPTKPVTPTKPPIKPAGGINTAEEYEAKAFDLMDKLTAVFGGAGTNCDKLADNLDVFLDVNKAAITATDQFQDANPSAEDDLEAKLQARMQVFMENAKLSMQACQKHARVQAALAKLPD